jgi:5-methylcytosine-specific restriction endonuclease McrA
MTQNPTFKFCRTCQKETERYVSGGCKPCSRSSALSRYRADPSKQKSYQKDYRKANFPQARAVQAAWREAHPGYHKQYRRDNPAPPYTLELAILRKKYYQKNKEVLKKRSEVYRRMNPDRYRDYQRKRRARVLENGGVLPRGIREKLFVLQKGLCACCGEPLGEGYHLDHILAISKGGPNTEGNVQLLRSVCNLRKGAT